jgi:hypothetical protein
MIKHSIQNKRYIKNKRIKKKKKKKGFFPRISFFYMFGFGITVRSSRVQISHAKLRHPFDITRCLRFFFRVQPSKLKHGLIGGELIMLKRVTKRSF